MLGACWSWYARYGTSGIRLGRLRPNVLGRFALHEFASRGIPGYERPVGCTGLWLTSPRHSGPGRTDHRVVSGDCDIAEPEWLLMRSSLLDYLGCAEQRGSLNVADCRADPSPEGSDHLSLTGP